jgi:hypothetical protein
VAVVATRFAYMYAVVLSLVLDVVDRGTVIVSRNSKSSYAENVQFSYMYGLYRLCSTRSEQKYQDKVRIAAT